MINKDLADKHKLALLNIFGFIIVATGALLGEIQSFNKYILCKILSILIVSTGGSILASVFVGFTLMHYKSTGKRKCIKQLNEFFNVNDLSKDVAIVIPRFSYSDVLRSTSNKSKRECGCKYSIKDTRLTNKYSLAFDDIVAARHISSIFSELGLAPPRIEFDDDAWNSIFGPKRDDDKLAKYETFIIIGLYSNDVTMEIANRRESIINRCFQLSPETDFYKGKRGISFCPPREKPHEWLDSEIVSWDLHIQSDLAADPKTLERMDDFALITKCFGVDGRPCLIIGGGRSRGTRKAASYFRKYWRDFYNHPTDNCQNHVAGQPFVNIFDLSGKKDSEIRPRGFMSPSS